MPRSPKDTFITVYGRKPVLEALDNADLRVDSAAFAINDQGVISGYSGTAAGETHAFLWRKGRMRDLGIASGYSTANDIDSRNHVVGAFHPGPGVFSHAYRWRRGSVTDLDKLGTYQSEAFAVNDHGHAAGWATFQGVYGSFHAALFARGRMTDLGTIMSTSP